MLGEHATGLLIQAGLVLLIIFVFWCFALLWKQGVSRIKGWMWGGVIALTCAMIFSAPYFWNRSMQFSVNYSRIDQDTGTTYSRAFWVVNRPSAIINGWLAYGSRMTGQIDYPLVEPFALVLTSAIIYTICGTLAGGIISTIRK